MRHGVIIQSFFSFESLGTYGAKIRLLSSVSALMDLNEKYRVIASFVDFNSFLTFPTIRNIWAIDKFYLAFIFVTKHLIAERAFYVLNFQMGRVDMTSQVICFHESNSTFRTQMRPER